MSTAFTPDIARRAIPARVADLGFAIDLPRDWVEHELPGDTPDFTNPTVLVPLAVITAPNAMIVFAAGARPAYDQGTLHEWAWYLLNAGPTQPRAVGVGRVGSHEAVIGEGVQESDFGEMLVRFAFFEDAGRLVNLNMSAPADIADVAMPLWFGAIGSFALTPSPTLPDASGPTSSR